MTSDSEIFSSAPERVTVFPQVFGKTTVPLLVYAIARSEIFPSTGSTKSSSEETVDEGTSRTS